MPELATDPRFLDHELRVEHHIELVQLLDEVFAKRPFDEWAGIFDASGVVFGPVQRVEDLVGDPQAKANRVFRTMHGLPEQRIVDTPIHMAGVQKAIPRQPPELGEHTRNR